MKRMTLACPFCLDRDNTLVERKLEGMKMRCSNNHLWSFAVVQGSGYVFIESDYVPTADEATKYFGGNNNDNDKRKERR